MTDIVEKLRMDADNANPYCVGQMEMLDAADEIETLRQRVKELEELQKTYNDYYRRQHHPRCDLLEAAGTDSLGNQCTCQQCIEEDVLAAERAISDKLEKVLVKLTADCMASDFNEHWDSFIDSESTIAELAAMRKGETK